MVEYKDECCGCATDSYPCLGSACPNRNVKVCYCDKCEEEFEPCELVHYEGMDLCKDCLFEEFDTLEE